MEMENPMKILGEILKERRKKAGLSQAKFAEAISSKPETITHIEIGRTVPIDETIWILCSSLCFNRDEILYMLDLAEYHRKHRPDLNFSYVIKQAEKILKHMPKQS
jgi:transcriptional regulator with XRE-family HTH domain